MTEFALDASSLGLGKYDPNQPRVPAGSGRESGRWTEGIDEAEAPHASSRSNIILAADQTTPGGVIFGKKIQNDMKARNFTPERIDEAVRYGPRIDAINKATGSPAIRYLNPTTGQSVVIDSTTNNAIHVGKPDYGYGPKGGDLPGATMRPAPAPSPTSVPIEEPIVIPDVILPP
jgi:hypothetical protein